MALITDKFGKASDSGSYAPATTVKNERTPGESVLSAFDLADFAKDAPVFFITYKKVTNPVTDEVSVTNQTGWKALVNADNNTLTNLTLAPGYTDTGNAVGDYIECIPTAFWANELVEGIHASHNPDGTLKDNAVTTAAIADGAVTSDKIDFTTFITDHTSSVTLASGVTAVSFSAITYGKLCILSGYLTKSGNWSNATPALTVPSSLVPGAVMNGSLYAVGQGASADKVARLYFVGNTLTVGNPSSSMANIVFEIIYTID